MYFSTCSATSKASETNEETKHIFGEPTAGEQELAIGYNLDFDLQQSMYGTLTLHICGFKTTGKQLVVYLISRPGAAASISGVDSSMVFEEE